MANSGDSDSNADQPDWGKLHVASSRIFILGHIFNWSGSENMCQPNMLNCQKYNELSVQLH